MPKWKNVGVHGLKVPVLGIMELPPGGEVDVPDESLEWFCAQEDEPDATWAASDAEAKKAVKAYRDDLKKLAKAAEQAADDPELAPAE